jgi:Xaa-Pro aminopeptidase
MKPMDVASRVPRLRQAFVDAECDALLVTRLVNIRYLTGFTGSAALLLVRPDDLLFVTDGRYRDQSALELGAAGVDARVRIGLTAGSQKEMLQEEAAGVPRIFI